ncbi:MAG TPA: hypothetical protein VIH05_00870 [Tepidiformaceae bacterium]
MSLAPSAYTTSTSKGGCGCSDGFPCPPGQGSGMERTRFFPRQLVAPDDLTQDQIYFRDKALRHNRLLHGWGVVCGARVMANPSDTCKVVVEAGYILGPYGHEILIDKNVDVDLCHEGLDGNAVSACGGGDPWCTNVRVGRPGGRTLYLAVRHDECETRPVRAQGHGCGCAEADCEYSRIRDGYAIKVLLDLPSSYSDPMPQPDIEQAVSCVTGPNGTFEARACPPCPLEPWVILADIVLGDDGKVNTIDCFAHRRYVASFADFYFLCQQRTRGGYTRNDIITDLRAESENAEPAGILVNVARADGTSAYLPVNYEVERGETVANFLAREGDREYADPATGETFTLREVYAITGVDPATTFNSPAEAAAVIEGQTLRLDDLRTARTGLGELFDTTGTGRLDEEHLGSPAAAADLPATTLRGVSADSPLGTRLEGQRIADVVAEDRAAFVERMAEGAPANRRTALRRQAGETWDAASAANRLTETWREGGTR